MGLAKFHYFIYYTSNLYYSFCNNWSIIQVRMEIKKITLNILFILSISFAYEKLDYKIKNLCLYLANCDIKIKEIYMMIN